MIRTILRDNPSRMSLSALHHAAQADQAETVQTSALDLLVKYAIVLTWLVYAAGLARISEFLVGVNVPVTESSFFVLQRVFSLGGYVILAIVSCAVVGLVVFAVSENNAPRLADLGWLAPTLFFMVLERELLKESSVLLSLEYAFCFLGASYLIIFLMRRKNFIAWPISRQLFTVLLLFVLIINSSALTGYIDAYLLKDAPPHVQFLLTPDAVAAASELGLTFSTQSKPNLSDPVNIVAISDTTYYLLLKQRSGGEEKIGYVGVGIPRDKVLMTYAH